MSEMVLVLPLLIFVLLAVVYVGYGMVRTQAVDSAARFESWRRAAGAPGPRMTPPYGHRLINQTFFGEKAASVGGGVGNEFPDDAERQLIDAAYGFSNQTGRLAELVLAALPDGSRARISARFATRFRSMERFRSTIARQHVRIGNDWRFVNGWRLSDGRWVNGAGATNELPGAAQAFLQPMDDRLQEAGDLGQTIRRLYRVNPRYVGPEVPLIVP
jgi:hypothetical protein